MHDLADGERLKGVNPIADEGRFLGREPHREQGLHDRREGHSGDFGAEVDRSGLRGSFELRQDLVEDNLHVVNHGRKLVGPERPLHQPPLAPPFFAVSCHQALAGELAYSLNLNFRLGVVARVVLQDMPQNEGVADNQNALNAAKIVVECSP